MKKAMREEKKEGGLKNPENGSLEPVGEIGEFPVYVYTSLHKNSPKYCPLKMEKLTIIVPFSLPFH